jgi:tellurite resistance protein
LKIIRIVFCYIVFFFISFVAGGILIHPKSDGLFVLFSFLAPVVMVWWYERRRARRLSNQLASTPDAREGTWARSPSLASPTKTAPVAVKQQPRVLTDPPSNSRSEQSSEWLHLYNAAVERKEREASSELAAASAKKETEVVGNAANWQQLDLAAVVRKNREALAQLASSSETSESEDPPARAIPSMPVASVPASSGVNSIPKASPIDPAKRHQGWLPKGQAISVGGRQLYGMIYVGVPPTLNRYGYGEKCRAYIDLSLPVSREGNDKAGTGMSYWPGYSGIAPECRATYLDWLSAGAVDGSYNPGYLFLYFYGLERRFFVEDPSFDEKCDLLDEARRLIVVFADNHSVRRYLGEFIEYALAATTEITAIQPVFDNPGWDVPFSVKLAIGARLQKGENLGADWVLSWFLCHPEKNLRTSAKRCQDEFMALFRLRFDERFPLGLKVPKPRTALKANYQAASREFECSVTPNINGQSIPDISGVRKPIEIAQEIADAVMEDLEKFSRYLGRNPDGRGSIEAHALLPAALRHLFPSTALEGIRAWARAVVEAGGMVPVSEVLERLEGERPDQLGKRQLTGAADALARIGYGLAPDPRFALRSPTLDEPVVLFDLGAQVEQLEDVSTRYKAALMELALATFVAHADGTVSGAEKATLEAQVRSVDRLSDLEQKQLLANLIWFIAVPPDLALLRRKLKETGANQQSAIRAVLVAAAHADGIVSTEEVAGVEKIYRALGLDPNLVYSDLHAGEVSDAPMRVRAAQTSPPGEAIPAMQSLPGKRLDAARIASIRQDTDRVSAVLADIFSTEAPVDDEAQKVAPSPLAGLDTKHTALIRELIIRPHWTEEDFAELTARHGLMVAGALETVNEWAFGVHDEALLEEYEGYDVSPDIADALADKFEKER